MNTFLKTTLILFPGVLLLMGTALFSQADAQNRFRASGDTTVTAQERSVRTQGTAQRGIFQPRDNRLVLQLDNLTEDQIDRIDAMNLQHREKVMELREKMRSNVITREVYLAERRANYENHQQELKKVLTKAQWEQLQELRAERRRPGSDD